MLIKFFQKNKKTFYLINKNYFATDYNNPSSGKSKYNSFRSKKIKRLNEYFKRC
jgi:hypothetical protein